MDAIKTNSLTKYYGKARGMIDVNLTVAEGDFFGFIGPNGAGKSTTIRTLLGLISPTSGSAEVLGMDIRAQKNQILAKVGYLPSETNFYRGMKVREILKLSADLRHMDCKAEAALLCERLDLDPNRKVDELSFGNRKKVGIVCALQHKPRLYILDEPTGGLDPLMQKEFYSILQERNKAGATVFLSSHVLSEVERYCKRAAVIREGRILVSDSVGNLGHTGVKRVSIRGISSLSLREGIKDIQIKQDGVTFLYDGSAQELLSLLTTLKAQDFTVTDPDLEEIFLHYYTKEES
ncbi:MAG: ABC transporter ATP-binding protein [Ruminococcaceae bacterium]|nr:ABC transporter ATP-binding protein [Oscillospiraceae bacterium]